MSFNVGFASNFANKYGVDFSKNFSGNTVPYVNGKTNQNSLNSSSVSKFMNNLGKSLSGLANSSSYGAGDAYGRYLVEAIKIASLFF